MESSINSFGITIANLLKQIDITLDKIERKQYEYSTDLSIEDIDLDDNALEDLLIGNKVSYSNSKRIY